MFVKALKKYRKNYQMVANALKHRTAAQVPDKVYNFKYRTSNQDQEIASKIRLNGISIGEHPRWTKKEEETFVKMFNKYGKNYALIKAKIPTKTHLQVRDFGYHLYKRIKANPKHKHFALRKKLKPRSK